MARQEVEHLITAYADGELGAEDRARVETALRVDPGLQREIDQVRELRQAAARSMGRDAAPAALLQRIRADINEASHTQHPAARWYSMPLGVAAAALLLAVGTWLTWPRTTDLEQTPVQLAANSDGDAVAIDTQFGVPTDIAVVAPAALVERHRGCPHKTPKPGARFASMTLADAREEVAADAGFPVLVADLRDSGWHLAGVSRCQLICQRSATPIKATHVFYERTGAESLFVSVFSIECRAAFALADCAPKQLGGPEAQNMPMYQESISGEVLVVHWQQGERSFAACGDAMSPSEVRGLVGELQQQFYAAAQRADAPRLASR